MEFIIKFYLLSYGVGLVAMFIWTRRDKNSVNIFDFSSFDDFGSWLFYALVGVPMIGFFFVMIFGIVISLLSGDAYIGRY